MTGRTMQRIVVSGANRGIGLGFVRVYVERGDQVFACCRRPRQAGLLGEIARQRPDQCTVVGMDVTSKSQVHAAVEQVSRHTNGVDVLINNAGVFFPSTGLADIDPGELLESMAVNAVGPMLVAQAFLALVRAGTTPKIVNITAPTRPLADLKAAENHSYLASRYALNALTRMIAAELADQGVLVMALWPGYLRTDMNGMDEQATPPDQALPNVVEMIDRIGMEASGTCLLPDGVPYRW